MNKKGILLVGVFLSPRPGTRSMDEELSLRLSAIGWKIIETSYQTSRAFRLVDMLYSAFVHRKEYQVANVSVFSGLAFFWAEMVVNLLYFFKKRIILSLHGGGLIEFAQRNPTRVARLFSRANTIVTPSLFLQVGLRHFRSNIRYLPNGIDVNRYVFQVHHNHFPKIIWLRAFHEIYQPELAVKAISFLIEEFKNITLIMIGPDKKDGSLHSVLELAQRLGVLSHVNIIGPISNYEVPNWLAKGDIFLNTTRFESFGVSVLEAALIGLPIVTTNVGELSYLWENQKTAMLVSQNDPEAMAAAIQRILIEPGLAERLSQNARKKAEQYDWSVILPQWEALFAEVINRPERMHS